MNSPAPRAVADRSKINIHQPQEVKYWTKELGVSSEDLHRAIEKVGNSAATVRKQLTTIDKGNGSG